MATSPQPRVVLDHLPGRPQAEFALKSALGKGKPLQVLVLVVNRLPLVNERFGYDVGDRILEAYSDRLTRELAVNDYLCRWSAAALIAFLGPGGSRHTPVTPIQFEETVQLKSGPVRMRLSASSRVYCVDRHTPLDDLVRNIDYFVAAELDVA